MKDVVGSTLEEVRRIKAIQRSVGALENGWIGNQTLSDIAAKLGADCWPLNVELYGPPGKVVRDWSCHYPRPESVLYKTTDGAVRIARVSSAAALGGVVWAVGGLGLLDRYDPAAEGFTGAYSDVLRKTNHTVLGYKGGMLYGVYCKAMTAQQVNAFVRDKLKLEYAVMLDGGHVAAIHAAVSRINTNQRQYYAVRFL